MAITVRCSSCRQQFQVREGLAGKSIVCRECGAEFQARAASAGDWSGDDPPDAAVGNAGGSNDYPAARPSRKSRPKQSEPVLTRRPSDNSASNTRARGAGGGQRAVWIYLGAGGLWLLVVVLVINSVGSSPQPPADPAMVAPPQGNAAPPPVTRRTEQLPRETATARKSPGTKQPDKEMTVATEKSAGGETGRDEPELTIGHGSMAWQVSIDPPAAPFELDDKKKISATMPKNSSGGIVFPDCPSPFVALGSNNAPREIREVRDLQGNRRIGSVKNATIVNAWVALSPDGQYFAAWSAGQNQIGVWAVKAEKPRGTIRVAGVAVPRLLTFAGNNRLVAIGGGDDLFTWHIPSGSYERSFVIPKIN